MRFAAHHRFRPDFCRAADPPSLRPRWDRAVTRKVDKLSCVRVGSARYSVPTRMIGAQVEILLDAATLWVVEPVTGELLAEHALVAPGEASVLDEHYGCARPKRPRRAPRARTRAERRFLALGPAAEAFLTAAGAAGVSRLAGEVADIVTLADSHGAEALIAALERAVAFGRWRAADVARFWLPGPGSPPRRRRVNRCGCCCLRSRPGR